MSLKDYGDSIVISAATTTALGAGLFFVELEWTEADGTEHYYEDAHGELIMRNPEGGG